MGRHLNGVEGKGRTRIDTILANKAAFPLIARCKIRWDLLLSDHAPIEVTMSLKKYGAKTLNPKLPHPFPEVKWTARNRKDKGKERDETWKKAWSDVERKFRKAEEKKDVEGMHRWWCKAAVETLKVITETKDR